MCPPLPNVSPCLSKTYMTEAASHTEWAVTVRLPGVSSQTSHHVMERTRRASAEVSQKPLLAWHPTGAGLGWCPLRRSPSRHDPNRRRDGRWAQSL